ncbi:MAG: glutamine synthetase [Elusimicrobiales bacterium]|nr:glutamine synthetase [Elusimicrobiales bacterium]
MELNTLQAVPQNKIYANKIAAYLNKEPKYFTREDLVRYIKENGVKMLNFRYVAGDGRLKTLNFIIHSEDYLNRILSAGERVDGSSLFKGIDAGSSDLYVVPRYRTAFVNPFSAIPAVDIICAFYTKEGKPFASAPTEILRRAEKEFTKKTGLEFYAMGELEYYVMSEKDPLYPSVTQKGYHEAYPFAKWENLRTEAMELIAAAGGKIKYGHSEVGFIRSDNKEMTQQEIEFLPVPASDAADQLAVSKWILSGLGKKYGVTVSFAPKISIGHAGSGLHIHTCLMKDGKNVMLDGNNELSEESRKLIAGFMELAAPITAFGNTVPTSYFRLVPHQEAPVNVCWAFRNRSALVRIPLGWTNAAGMIKDANPDSEPVEVHTNQTVEIRSADGSANVHMLIASLCVAAMRGFARPDYKEYSEKFYVDRNIHDKDFAEQLEKLPHLPFSCAESGKVLLECRAAFEQNDIFPPAVIDSAAERLKSFHDETLRERLTGKVEEMKRLVEEYLYC